MRRPEYSGDGTCQEAGRGAPEGASSALEPLTGEKGLFIGAFAQRLRIIGVSPYESADILRLLQDHVTRPEHVVRVA
jgi:hypothetical protein